MPWGLSTTATPNFHQCRMLRRDDGTEYKQPLHYCHCNIEHIHPNWKNTASTSCNWHCWSSKMSTAASVTTMKCCCILLMHVSLLQPLCVCSNITIYVCVTKSRKGTCSMFAQRVSKTLTSFINNLQSTFFSLSWYFTNTNTNYQQQQHSNSFIVCLIEKQVE